MSKFKDFVTNKTVAVVGPAATLRGKKAGTFIDDHDIVVRLNHSWPLVHSLRGDIGRRTDVIYHNMSFRDQPMNKKIVSKMYRDGVRWMVSTRPRSEKRFNYQLKKFRRINRGVLKFRCLSKTLKKRMVKHVKRPNAGIIAIKDLLTFPIKRLYVTGFSFYSTGYLEYPNYKPIYAKKAVRHHNQRQNKAYLARMIAKDSRLEVDPVILRLLDDHLNDRKDA